MCIRDRLEVLLAQAAQRELSVVALQGHRRKCTGTVYGRICGYHCIVAGARTQGSPEGLMLCFDATFAVGSFQTQVITLPGRIQYVRYINPRQAADVAWINVLSPGEEHPIASREKFYTLLTHISKHVKARTVLHVMGDLNAHLGPLQCPPLIGGWGYDEDDNDNGTLFRQYCLLYTSDAADE